MGAAGTVGTALGYEPLPAECNADKAGCDHPQCGSAPQEEMEKLERGG